MPTTAQPAAGTSLPAGSLTTGLVHARNEADTTASTVLAGTATRTTSGGGTTYATDGDGRYKRGAGSAGREDWTISGSNFFGPEYTILVILKLVTGGSTQAMVDSDANPPRNFQFRVNSSNGIDFIGFAVTDGSGDIQTATPSGTVSTTGYSAAIARVRNDAGTYKIRSYLDANASTEISLAATAETIASGEAVGQGDRVGGSQDATGINVYFTAIWNRALSDAEVSALQSAPWSIFDAGASVDQAAFRFRNDDGSESAATWAAAQGSNVTMAAGSAARVRFLLQAAGDPTGKAFQLEYRKVGDTTWKKVS